MDRITSDRANSLIGKFMLRWSFVEYEVDKVITELLGLNIEQSILISSTLSVRQKISILQESAFFSLLKGDDKKRYQKLIEKLFSNAKDRNTVAHSMFFASNDGSSVEFFRVKKNKDKSEFPMIKWDMQEFATRFKQLYDLSLDLDDFRENLGRFKTAGSLAEALSMSQTKPVSGLGLLGGIGQDS